MGRNAYRTKSPTSLGNVSQAKSLKGVPKTLEDYGIGVLYDKGLEIFAVEGSNKVFVVEIDEDLVILSTLSYDGSRPAVRDDALSDRTFCSQHHFTRFFQWWTAPPWRSRHASQSCADPPL